MSSAWVQISSDPFSRTDVMRKTVDKHLGGCDWCDKTRASARLFKYGTGKPNGRVDEHKGAFCCKPCHDAYHM